MAAWRPELSGPAQHTRYMRVTYGISAPNQWSGGLNVHVQRSNSIVRGLRNLWRDVKSVL